MSHEPLRGVTKAPGYAGGCLLGRTYAAAIERGAKSESKGDDFYFEVVAPKLRDSRVDEMLNDPLFDSDSPNDSTLKKSLEVHRYLTDLFSEMSGKNNRSLASKYLHFHRRKAFFIYDSRAEKAASHWVKYPNKDILSGIDCDPVYGTFLCRIRELRQFLAESPYAQSNRDDCLDPRDIDNFLLWSFNRIPRVGNRAGRFEGR
jgi:hypothetical protein